MRVGEDHENDKNVLDSEERAFSIGVEGKVLSYVVCNGNELTCGIEKVGSERDTADAL